MSFKTSLVKIRKVGYLQDSSLKHECERQGLQPNDLILISETIEVEKVIGNPVSWLLKRAGRSEVNP